MDIYIVYLTDDYEAWNVEAMFINEADAIACATALTEASKESWREIYEVEGDDPPYHNTYVAQAKHAFASLAEYEQRKQGA